MTESEKVTERYLVREVEKLGGEAYKVLPSQHSGLPDRLCLLPGGRVLFVEVKSKGRKPTKLQEVTLRDLRRLGFTATIVDTRSAVDRLLESIKYER